MNISTTILGTNNINEFVEVINLFEDVFEMENFTFPSTQTLQSTLANPNFLVMVARHDEVIVGGLTVYVLSPYYSEKAYAYIFDLAVRREYQRKGIGKQLIRALNEYCRANNVEEVFVQADVVDYYALDFYRSTKPTGEEQVIHFTYAL